MNSRKEITGKLLNLLRSKTSGKHSAEEVVLDIDQTHGKHVVDYMTFEPARCDTVDGIEKGIFTCYEIKSCYADLYSGNGLNFVGEKNYLVTTSEVYNKMLKENWNKLNDHVKNCNSESHLFDIGGVGVMVAIPQYRETSVEVFNPKPFDIYLNYRLEVIMSCHPTSRRRSMVELLYCMLRAK